MCTFFFAIFVRTLLQAVWVEMGVLMVSGVTADIASHELKDIVIAMQSQMITTLHILLGGGTANYEDLLSISEGSRIRAVSTFGEQFQRMATAAPLAKDLLPTLTKDLPIREPSTRAPSLVTMKSARSARQSLIRRLALDGTGKPAHFDGLYRPVTREKQEGVEKNGIPSGARQHRICVRWLGLSFMIADTQLMIAEARMIPKLLLQDAARQNPSIYRTSLRRSKTAERK